MTQNVDGMPDDTPKRGDGKFSPECVMMTHKMSKLEIVENKLEKSQSNFGEIWLRNAVTT